MADESILDSIKLSLGVPIEHKAFDTEIIMHINSALATLAQLGVGPLYGLEIEDDDVEWTDLIGTDKRLNGVKTYVSRSTKMYFDPPDTGFVLTANKEQLKEMEWRLMVAAEEGVPGTSFDLTAGAPFIKTFRVKNAKLVWASIDDLEVHAHLRTGLSSKTTLVADLRDYMTYVYDGNDLVITLQMTGADTRTIYNRMPEEKIAYFNIVVSDLGTVDSRAIVIPVITVKASDITVSSGG